MACCLVCFSGEPIEGEARRPNQWQVPLKEGCSKDPCHCCFGFWCAECAAMKLRKKSLDARGEWPAGYKCCQGVIPACACFKPGEMGEADNACCCLCLEAWCCTGISTSSTYIFVMETYQLDNDPCYNKFVRFNNCIQILACFCTIASIFISDLREAAQCVRLIADFVFRTLMGCINAQVNFELDYQIKRGPQTQVMGAPPAPRPAYGGGSVQVQQGPPQQGYPLQQQQPVMYPPQQQPVYVQQQTQPVYGQYPQQGYPPQQQYPQQQQVVHYPQQQQVVHYPQQQQQYPQQQQMVHYPQQQYR
eukprot:TRINITY_DN435_c0_g2_i2.p1 TRINITY_DN435_c0_g2~~TRINITY_DN435_c0_g2_i2.p1  ORF type:complete len:322 (+),score=56.56 TRINITY_DN435_c0_g2_i2:57-968(+)